LFLRTKVAHPGESPLPAAGPQPPLDARSPPPRGAVIVPLTAAPRS